jgi:hypothetical protein
MRILDKNSNNKKFEDIKHIDENGSEYWNARKVANSIRI